MTRWSRRRLGITGVLRSSPTLLESRAPECEFNIRLANRRASRDVHRCRSPGEFIRQAQLLGHATSEIELSRDPTYERDNQAEQERKIFRSTVRDGDPCSRRDAQHPYQHA